MLVQSEYPRGPYKYDMMLIRAPPNIEDNDVCLKSKCVAIGTSVVSNLSLATSDENEVKNDCARGNVTSSQRGLWFSFLGTGERVWVDTCARLGTLGEPTPTQVSVYVGSCGWATLQCVAGARDPCSSFIFDAALEKITFGTQANTVYYVLVQNLGVNDRSSLFNLQITNIPTISNDECSAATPFTIGQTIDGDLEFATPEPKGTINNCMYPSERYRGLWYSFQGNGGVVTFLGDCSTDTTGTHISIYKGTCGVATLQCVVGFDIRCAQSNVSTLSGTKYYVHVADIGRWPPGRTRFGFSTASLSPVAPINALTAAPTKTLPTGTPPAFRTAANAAPPQAYTTLCCKVPAVSPPNPPACRKFCRTR
jgi:hypothetical protein